MKLCNITHAYTKSGTSSTIPSKGRHIETPCTPGFQNPLRSLFGYQGEIIKAAFKMSPSTIQMHSPPLLTLCIKDLLQDFVIVFLLVWSHQPQKN
jgi:hypothetical protein